MIDRVLHDDEAETLAVWFKGRGQYIYEHVPRAIYDALIHAQSAGAVFNDAVKGRYPCHRAGKRYAP